MERIADIHAQVYQLAEVSGMVRIVSTQGSTETACEEWVLLRRMQMRKMYFSPMFLLLSRSRKNYERLQIAQ